MRLVMFTEKLQNNQATPLLPLVTTTDGYNSLVYKRAHTDKIG